MSELPEGWVECEIGELAQSIKNGFVSRQNKEGVGFPMTRIETIADGTINEDRVGFASDVTIDRIKDYALIPNDILFSHINSPSHLGKTAIYRGQPNPLYHGMNLLLIRVDEAATNPGYFEYALRLLRSQGVFSLNAQHAVNQASINQKKLKSVKIPLAPLTEQKRIADKLDALLARVDDCRARLARVPAILKRFRQAILAAATSGALTADWREKNALAEDEWTITSVGKLIEDIEAGINFQCEERPPAHNEKGLVKISAVTWGNYDDEESKTLPIGKEVPEQTRICEGDFLISRANTLELVGACVIVHKVNRPVYLSDKVLRLVVNDEKLKRWLLYWLRSPQGRNQIESLASGNQLSMRNISQANLKNISVLLPCIEEQREIVRRVETLFGYADRLEARYQAALTRVERLTPALLAKAFRGELVAQDPADEPAALLLARVQAARGAVGESPLRRRSVID